MQPCYCGEKVVRLQEKNGIYCLDLVVSDSEWVQKVLATIKCDKIL